MMSLVASSVYKTRTRPLQPNNFISENSSSYQPFSTTMTTEVVYKPHSKSTDEFKIIVHLEEYKKWKAGQEDGWKEGETETTVEDVKAGGGVLHSGQGKQGIQGTPSNQQLDTIFKTHNMDRVMEIILEKGTVQAASGIGKNTPITNAARGSGVLDNRGQGLTGI